MLAQNATIAEAGAQISRIEIPEFAEVAQTAQVATFPAAEGFAWHRDLMARAKDRYDPRVAERLERGRQIGAADYLWLLRQREQLIAAMRARAAALDVLAMLTVPIAAPLIADLERDGELYHRLNLLVLRNSTLVNLLDGCVIQRSGALINGIAADPHNRRNAGRQCRETELRYFLRRDRSVLRVDEQPVVTGCLIFRRGSHGRALDLSLHFLEIGRRNNIARQIQLILVAI